VGFARGIDVEFLDLMWLIFDHLEWN
jgi:hypothetical protein